MRLVNRKPCHFDQLIERLPISPTFHPTQQGTTDDAVTNVIEWLRHEFWVEFAGVEWLWIRLLSCIVESSCVRKHHSIEIACRLQPFLSSQVMQMVRGFRPTELPPHIYSQAQTAYQSMLNTSRDQTIVLSGQTGSGKTTSLKHILSYYCHSYGGLQCGVLGKNTFS